MKRIYRSFRIFIQKDVGLSQAHSFRANVKLLTYYLSHQLVTKTREHSINQAIDRVNQLQFGFIGLFA